MIREEFRSRFPRTDDTLTIELTTEFERRQLQRLRELVEDRARREAELERRHHTDTREEQLQYQEVFDQLAATYEGELQRLETFHTSQCQTAELQASAALDSVQAEFDRILQQIDERNTAETEAARKEHDEAGWMVSSLLDGDTSDSPLSRLQAMETGFAASRTELELAVNTLVGWTQSAGDFLQRCRMLSETTPPDPAPLPPDLASLHQLGVEAARTGEPIQRRLRGRILPRLFRGVWPVLLFLACTSLLAGLIWSVVPPSLLGLKLEPGAPDWFWIATGTGSAVSLILMFLIHLAAGHRAVPDYEQLVQLAVNAESALQRWSAASRQEIALQQEELTRLHEARERTRERAVERAETRLAERLAAAAEAQRTERDAALKTYPARLAEIRRSLTQYLQQMEAATTSSRQSLLLRREADFRHLQSEFDERLSHSRQDYQRAWGQLIRDWNTGLREIGATSDELCELARRQCPRWATVLGGWLESRQAPGDGANAAESCVLSIGRIIADLQDVPSGLSGDPRLAAERTRFEFPIWMSPALKPSLVAYARDEHRTTATDLLQTAMLRFLTTLPPGQVRFTIIDPVGLGANFASFMHLSDIDEQLVTSRIWTEPAHIEKRLADLTEHMETVLQTYLRNEYASLDDYNRDAGEVAEPYRVVTIANFPANFTDLALRRLVSIAQGGVKCGVFVLMSVDERLDLPRGFSRADLESHATVLRVPSAAVRAAEPLRDLGRLVSGRDEDDAPSSQPPGTGHGTEARATDSGFRLADPVLGEWPLEFDAPPIAEEFGELVRRAGHLSRSVRRVEVPFERVMPPTDGFWTSSTRQGIDLPIGRAGATKLQHLRLGKGTSQHVLIAGKTGSGKSSLLHALITNAALHYSPDEIEFYLIDFKKGVEFKAYAAHELPHARVIAIESDREFGVSVLQRLDGLLKERGELFRRTGVQDLPGFRTACPDQPLPRVLLIIDEFQEFFIEDDALSQSAALLLDRLVRQGRAFGVHVLLGSQTLAGAYSLARSTLGQIAVRIALQCSDTDAHLILSEDNTAARLLSRPGEAIYNDANGLVEGNHPFQVVWLDDTQREVYLDWMGPWADEYLQRAGGGRLWPRPVVFEGNVPADAEQNPRFVALRHQIGAEASAESGLATRSCWIGESVALTGATELQFGPREGGPVLIAGRDEDLALGILTNMVLALAGQGSPRFLVLDGTLADSPAARTWRALSRWIPSLRIVSPREAGDALKELGESQPTRTESDPPWFVIVFDLARFRELRKSDDEYGGFEGFNKAKAVSPASVFAELVKEGAPQGIVPFVWCDGYAAAQRFLGRDLLGRFETRVVLPMNANDSSNLIDSPAAGRLGPNRALLFRGDLGTLEKFRPYQAPTPGWIDEQCAASGHAGASKENPVAGSAPAGSRPESIDAVTTERPDGSEDPPEGQWTDISELNVS